MSDQQTPAEDHKTEDCSAEDRKIMERRNALKRLVLTTAYAVPIATVLLTGANRPANGSNCLGEDCQH